jgi:hypothetical protein
MLQGKLILYVFVGKGHGSGEEDGHVSVSRVSLKGVG